VIQQPLMPHPLESWYDLLMDEPQLRKKSNKKSMVRTITKETKREGQRKAKICTAHRNF